MINLSEQENFQVQKKSIKYGVIDIGSNSVRLMISQNGKTLNKFVKITRLAQNMSNDNILNEESMKRTAFAVSFFVDMAKDEKVDFIFCFATAAVRYATNKQDFVNLIKITSGIDVDVITGEQEAKIGILGALNGNDGGLIDIGGASTEIGIVSSGEIIYEKSIRLGVVSATEVCGQDVNALNLFIDKALTEFGSVPNIGMVLGVGGTVTNLASIILELAEYDRNLVDGFIIDIHILDKIIEKIKNIPVEERKSIVGLQEGREQVILSGAVILKRIMLYLNIEQISVSESDNTEGYLLLKRGLYE